MYATNKIAERISQAESEFGLTLEPHSVEDVTAFDEYLVKQNKYTYDDMGRASGTQNLNQFDRDWMQNEQALVMCDASYALTRYAYIKDEQNIIRRFAFRIPQHLLFDIICDLEAADSAIEIMVLKARQLGTSTLVELLISLRIIFGYGINAIIGSADRTKTALMANMLFLLYDMLPVWMRPQWTRRVESDQGMLVFGHSMTGVSFQHGAQASGIARGTTPTIYHLCLSGNTLVRTANSQVKPIKELDIKEFVWSIHGNLAELFAVSKSPRRNELTSEICVWGTPTAISCTRDHKILTHMGWKEAKEISNNDWLIHPVRPISMVPRLIEMQDFIKWKHKSRGTKTYTPTFELGRLVGLYLAEGYVYYSKQRTPVTVGFGIHCDEIERTEEWIEAVFGINDRPAQRRKNSKTAVVALGHRGFAKWLIENFGTKDNKHVPDVCWQWGKDFCRGLVYGYLAGDGHYPVGSNEIYATSIRVAISLGIRDLIASLGHGWSQISFRKEGVWYNRNCRDAWVLVIAGSTAVSLRNDFQLPTIESKRLQPPLHWRWSALTHIEVQVESVRDGYSEDFYDIEVADQNHAFLTPSGIVHNSECSSFTDPVNQIEASLFKAVHASPHVFGVLESTGEGDKGWWPDTWRHAKANWPQRRSRLCPLFLPWFVGTDLYPTSTWLKMRPVPEGWHPNHDTRLHVAKSELYVHSQLLLSKHLGNNYHMPREQQWYWEVEHEQAKAKDIESVFLQEMCGDDEEALQRSSESVFGHHTIDEINTRRELKYEAYGLSGQSIEDSHEPPPEDIDYQRERIPIRYVSSNHGDVYRWELIPLRFLAPLRENDPDDAVGKLFVFHPPTRGINYSLGVDTSEGKGQDSTVISVWAVGSKGTPDTQCAEFASSYVNHVEAFSFVLAIAAYYGQFMEQGITRWKEPYVSIEQVAAVGDTCQLQMRKMGYSNFHRMVRYDSKKIKKASATKIGWYTFGWSRPLLTGNFVHSAQNGWAEINSPWLIEEMKHFEVHVTATGKEKMEHEEGEHDDRIFAAAMAIFCPHDMDILAERSKKRMVETTALPSIDMGEYRGQTVNAAQLSEKNVLTLDDIAYSSDSLERFSR